MTDTMTSAATSGTEPREYGHFIDGEMVAGEGATIDRYSPGDGRLVARYADGDAATMQRAIGAARRAFDDGPWPRMSGMERARYILALAQALRSSKESLARIEAEEVGKPIRMARQDVDGSIGMFEYAAGLAMSMHGEVHTNLEHDFTGLILREPAGVAGLVTPWNFPLLLLAQKLPFAIGAGCTTVAKPASVTAGTTLEVARLCQEVGLPAGVYNVVTGGGGTVGQLLAESHDVDMLSFTGSTDTGRRVVEASKSNLKRVSMELGGKSANIVFEDADLEDALDGVMFGILFNTGMCCVSGSRLLLQESIAERFLGDLVARIERLKVGRPLDESADLGAVIHGEHLEKIISYVDIARTDGSVILTGGQRLTDGDLGEGYYIAPTVIDRVPLDSRVCCEEIFGPVLAVTRFDGLDQAIAIANNTEYGLANTVWTKDIDKALRAARALRSGTVWINTTIDGAPQLPGGGTKTSGYGREMGQIGFDEFTEPKTIQIRTGKRKPYFLAG